MNIICRYKHINKLDTLILLRLNFKGGGLNNTIWNQITYSYTPKRNYHLTLSIYCKNKNLNHLKGRCYKTQRLEKNKKKKKN